MTSWNEIRIPQTREIRHRSVDLESNPFDGWQEKFDLSHGRLTRLAILPGDGAIALLDPFMANVIVLRPEGEGGMERWGKWGVWEGSLHAPKSIAVWEQRSLLIADPLLKAVFWFDRLGNYLGTLGVDGSLFRPKYASQVIADSERVYVADLLGNQIVALRPTTAPPLVSSEAAGEASFLRANLFRDPHVVEDRTKFRCLLCHDGTVSDETDKFLTGTINHPVGVEQKAKNSLPLLDGAVTCSSCHDPHHGATHTKTGKKDQKGPKAPFLHG
jgi:hypothetical protein